MLQHQPNTRRGRLCLMASFFVGLAGLTLTPPCGAREDEALPTIERAMVKVAHDLALDLQKRGYSNVGVLKFLATTDGKRWSDSVGTLNMRLARQLELALVVRNNPKKPLGVIKNASAVAQLQAGASYLSRDGRKKLFAAKYPLHWGKKEVSADAFVTGGAMVSKDLTMVTMHLSLVDARENKRIPLEYDLKAKMDSSKLSEVGESFVLRDAFSNLNVVGGGKAAKEEESEQKQEEDALDSARKSRVSAKQHPYFAGKNPVTLEVFYDDHPVKITYRDSKAAIPTPREGQQVKFRLSRATSPETYGVVLKVNGENTVYKQKLPDLECTRWIMAPGSKGFPITGYQLDEKRFEEFRIATKEESDKLAIDFGEDAGRISLTVFRQRRGEEPPADPRDEYAKHEKIVKAAKMPEKEYKDFGKLKADLYKEEDRSLIIGGTVKEGNRVKKVKFDPDPVPLMHLTIVYFDPKKRE